MENLIKGPNLGTQLEGVDDWESQNEQFGGVAVWSIPPRIAPAYNPLIFRRARYYLANGDYQPAIIPNFIHFMAWGEVELDHPADADVYVQYLSLNSGEVVVGMIFEGQSRNDLGDDIERIIGLSFSEDGPFTPYLKTEGQYYIIPTNDNGTSPDTWVVVDDGYLLTTSEGYVMYANEEVESVSLAILNRLTGERGELFGTSYKGAISFDVAPLVRAWLADNLRNVDEDNLVVADRALFVRYSVDAIYQITEFVALNAVVQIGESTDLTDKEGTVLTTKPRLVYYEGYPLDYSVLSGSEIVPTPNGPTIPYSVSRVYVLEGLLLLLTENGTPILTEAGEYIYLYTGGKVGEGAPIEVVQRCVPASPFYVRWINTEGGVDYWMFERYQERTLGVDGVENARVYVANPYEAPSNVRTVAFSTTNEVKVGATMLGKGDFDALRKLALSPLIEWWNERTGRWVRLSVASYALNYGKEQPSRDFEITFALPELYTQQAVWQ